MQNGRCAKAASRSGWTLAEKRESLRQAAEEMKNRSKTKNEICLEYGVSWAGLYKYMKEHGISTPTNRGRQYTCDDRYFEVIDTQEKAYWLGFIFADGGITRVCRENRRPNVFKMRLNPRDREHLGRFAQAIGATNPISDGSSSKSGYSNQNGRLYRYSEIVIASVEFVKHLMAAGIVERKQFVPHHFPFNEVPAEMRRHFIRGVLDGDGSWSGRQFQITGGRLFISELQDWMVKDLGLNVTKLKTYKSTSAVSLIYGGRKQVERIGRYLYGGASVWLPRKFTSFTSYLSEGAGLYLNP